MVDGISFVLYWIVLNYTRLYCIGLDWIDFISISFISDGISFERYFIC